MCVCIKNATRDDDDNYDEKEKEKIIYIYIHMKKKKKAKEKCRYEIKMSWVTSAWTNEKTFKRNKKLEIFLRFACAEIWKYNYEIKRKGKNKKEGRKNKWNN